MALSSKFISSLRYIVIAVFLTLPSSLAWAQSELEVNFGVMELTPYGFKDKDGNTRGYFHELAKVLLEDSGLGNRISLIPLKRLLVEVEQKREDCLFIARTHLAEEKFRMVAPLGKDIPVGIVPEIGKDIMDYDDLAQHTIGVPIGVIIHKPFDNDETLTKEATPNYASSVKMLLLGRITAIAGNIDSFRYYSRRLGKDPNYVFGKPLIFARIPIWLACGMTHPEEEVVERLKASAKKLRENGTFLRLIDQYH